MDRDPEKFSEHQNFVGNVRRLFVGLAAAALVLMFLLWRVESERMERVRTAVVDALMPAAELGGRPLTYVSSLARRLDSHLRLAERIAELEAEVARLEHWKEQTRRLEQQNARLRGLLNAPKNPAAFTVSAQVIADTSSVFRHSVLINAGSENGVGDGWPALDGSGLAGRIAGVGRKTARVVLLADPSSRVPVKIVEARSRGIAVGDGTLLPQLRFASAASVNPGSRVVTSGDGGVYPPDIPLGDVIIGSDRILRVRLLADLWNLEYLILFRADTPEGPAASGGVITGRGSTDIIDP